MKNQNEVYDIRLSFVPGRKKDCFITYVDKIEDKKKEDRLDTQKRLSWGGDCFVIADLKFNLKPKVYYDCIVAPTRSGKGYKVIDAIEAKDDIVFEGMDNMLFVKVGDKNTDLYFNPEGDEDYIDFVERFTRSNLQHPNKLDLIEELRVKCKGLYNDYKKSFKKDVKKKKFTKVFKR